MLAPLGLLLISTSVTAFRPVGSQHVIQAARTRAPADFLMKDWTKRKTLADTEGGMTDKGAAAVGLIGTIPVDFTQGNDTRTTMAIVEQPLMDVAAQAGQYIKYKCRKGECGTCEVRVDGQWIRTCTAKVPYMDPGTRYSVYVRPGMVSKGKKSSRFFSFRSFLAGFKNNLVGMIGFVRESRKSQNQFEERMSLEQELLAKAAAKRAARAAEQSKGN